MRELETDYLVVGAGASGMAFVDTLLSESDAEVVMVDRRDRPGGHWLNAYPFVRIHQTSANYGVDSRMLGTDRIDTSGPNAGFYERSTAAEISDYFGRVLDEQFLPSGRVRFLPMSDYRGEDAEGHHVVSLLTGAETVVKPRRKFVDATYVESSIPSRHTRPYAVDADVRVIPPNDLVDLQEHGNGFTIVGAGKTAMDTCVWLLDNGVEPDRVQWIRPRDPWLFNRASLQPLDLVAAYMEMQGWWVEAAAAAEDGHDFAARMESHGVFLRIDPDVEPSAFRGATISERELDLLRSVDRVVRMGHVRRIERNQVTMEAGSVDADPGQIYVDCTARGVRPTTPRPVFEPGRVTLEYVTLGIVPWGAATIAAVEAIHDDDDEKNRLCPAVSFSGAVADLLQFAYQGMTGLSARGADPRVSEWNDRSRLNTTKAVSEHAGDPRVQQAFTRIFENIGPALANLERRSASTAAAS